MMVDNFDEEHEEHESSHNWPEIKPLAINKVRQKRSKEVTSSSITAAGSSSRSLDKAVPAPEQQHTPVHSVSYLSCLSLDQELEYDLYDCHLNNAMAVPGSLFAPAYWPQDITPTLTLELEQLFTGLETSDSMVGGTEGLVESDEGINRDNNNDSDNIILCEKTSKSEEVDEREESINSDKVSDSEQPIDRGEVINIVNLDGKTNRKEVMDSENVNASDDKEERNSESSSPVLLRSGQTVRKPLITSITSDLTASITSAVSDCTLVGDMMDTSCYYSGEEETTLTTSFMIKKEKMDIMSLTHIEEFQFVDEE